MIDEKNYLGYKAYTAKATTLADLGSGTGNFDFGTKGELGFFPDVFIKAHVKSGAQVTADILEVSIKDSSDGSSWTEIDNFKISGVVSTTTFVRRKLPVKHERYVKVMVGFTTDTTTPSSVTWEFYLERG